MSTTTNKKNAVKGTVAAAAGIAVLLGGAGTFALWNQSGSIGTTSTGIGQLTADFSGTTTWQDTTDGTTHDIANIGDFKMVPGDTVVGTTEVAVTVQGENLVVDAGIDYAEGTLPADVEATIVLNDGTTDVTQLAGSNEGSTYNLTAKVTLAFDAEAKGSMTQTIDLNAIKVNLQQQAPQNVQP